MGKEEFRNYSDRAVAIADLRARWKPTFGTIIFVLGLFYLTGIAGIDNPAANGGHILSSPPLIVLMIPGVLLVISGAWIAW